MKERDKKTSKTRRDGGREENKTGKQATPPARELPSYMTLVPLALPLPPPPSSPSSSIHLLPRQPTWPGATWSLLPSQSQEWTSLFFSFSEGKHAVLHLPQNHDAAWLAQVLRRPRLAHQHGSRVWCILRQKLCTRTDWDAAAGEHRRAGADQICSIMPGCWSWCHRLATPLFPLSLRDLGWSAPLDACCDAGVRAHCVRKRRKWGLPS